MTIVISLIDIQKSITNLIVCQDNKLHFIMVNMNVYQKEFIDNLKEYRTERKISQAQLAELCGVSTGTIGNVECGLAKPSFDLIISIAENLSIHPALLFSTHALIPEKYQNDRKVLETIFNTLQTEIFTKQ